MKGRVLGKQGEDLAYQHLVTCGYRFIDRNFSCPSGEVDLIFVDGETLVFVEVKTRIGFMHGLPQESVTPYKIKRLTNVIQWFVKSRKNLPSKMRIDVVAITLDATGKQPSIVHLKNVTG